MSKRREFTRADVVLASTRPEYRHWINMKSRCTNPNTPGFEHYGGRGIKVCDRWLYSFDAFFCDVGSRPTAKHSLDRFPNRDGDYEPKNVRWATSQEQARNTSRNNRIQVGEHLLSVTEAAERVGLNPNTIIYRLRRGWSASDALNPGNFKGRRP